MSTETDKSRGDVMDVNVRIEPVDWSDLTGNWRLIVDGITLGTRTLDELADLAEKAAAAVEVTKRLIANGDVREMQR
jgi:hypothetical protein